MKTVTISANETNVTLEQAMSVASAVSEVLLGESTCLSWYDKADDRESPAHTSECHEACAIPGYVDYAMNRGAELKVVIGDGDYVFLHRPLGEFAGLP